MESKQIISIILILLGVIGLIIGMFGIFGTDWTGQNPWVFAILGVIFFGSGIALLKSAKASGSSS